MLGGGPARDRSGKPVVGGSRVDGLGTDSPTRGTRGAARIKLWQRILINPPLLDWIVATVRLLSTMTLSASVVGEEHQQRRESTNNGGNGGILLNWRMKKLKYILALAILVQSTPAYADHEEGLIPLFFGLLTIVVLAFVLYAVHLNRIGKLILAIICLFAIVLTFRAVDSLSLFDDMVTINLLVVGVPLAACFVGYYALRNRFGKK